MTSINGGNPPVNSRQTGAVEHGKMPGTSAPVKTRPAVGTGAPKANQTEINKLHLSAQRELSLARQKRLQAEKYQRETLARAQSQAQLLVLQTRLEIRREIAEWRRQANEEMQQMLNEIRMMRVTAQEELGAQRKYTDAAKIRSLFLAFASKLEGADAPAEK